MIRSSYFFVISLLLVVAAVAGALDDIDFFNPADFSDRTSLHHEHLVVLAAGLAFLSFVLAVLVHILEVRAIERSWAEERV